MAGVMHAIVLELYCLSLCGCVVGRFVRCGLFIRYEGSVLVLFAPLSSSANHA